MQVDVSWSAEFQEAATTLGVISKKAKGGNFIRRRFVKAIQAIVDARACKYRPKNTKTRESIYEPIIILHNYYKLKQTHEPIYGGNWHINIVEQKCAAVHVRCM